MPQDLTTCPVCAARLVLAREAVDTQKGKGGPLVAVAAELRSRRVLGTVLVVISCLAAIPALLGSYVALACAFGGGEFGGKGAFGPAVVALLITAGCCAIGFLPLALGLNSFGIARKIESAAEAWQVCPSCGWTDEAIPEELLELMPLLRRKAP